jgi:WD40 repeat protein
MDELATCGMDKTLRIWDSRTGTYIRGFHGPNRVLSLAYSPDGKLLAAGTLDYGLYVWDTSAWDSSAVATTKGQPGVIAFSPNGTFLAAGTSPIQLWRVRDWRLERQRDGHEQGGDALAFSPDGLRLVSGNADGFAKIWSVPQVREEASQMHDYWVGGVGFLPDGSEWMTTSFHRDSGRQTMEIRSFDTKTGKLVRTLRGASCRGSLHGDTNLAISPDGKWLVTLMRACDETGVVVDDEVQCDEIASLDVWDLKASSRVASDSTQRNWHKVAVSPDSQRFAVTDTDGTLEIWSIQSFVDTYSLNRAQTQSADRK